jgi:hypothetical protein
VFTAATAYAAGWTASALRHAVLSGRLIRLNRGIFVPSELCDGVGAEADRRRFMIATIAATLAVRPAVASHMSGALLTGLPTWELPERPCVTVPPGYTGDARHAHLHRASLATGHVVVAGVPRTTSARTILDIAREHGTEDAVVAGDFALANGFTDVRRLIRGAEFCAGWPGIRRAHHVLTLLDGRSESPLESVSRLRLAFSGVPVPDLQPYVYDLDGWFRGRPDLYWDEFGVAGEVDGRLKYRVAPEDVIWREKRRQEPMEDTGIIFVRWGRPDLDDMPRLVHRLEAAFARGARRPRSDRGWTIRESPSLVPRIDAGKRSQYT